MTTDHELSEQPRISFLGVPVYGDFDEGDNRVDQWPIERFRPVLQELLDHPDFRAARWTQYTPYFNDGDPCTFSTNKPGFFLVSDEEDGEDLDSFDRYDSSVGRHPALGSFPTVWDEKQRRYIRQPYDGPDEERYRIFEAFSDAIEGGHFENVLLDAFGDHAEVLVTRDSIVVDHYSHD